MTRNNIPEKPNATKDQVSMLWDAVYNHLPSRLSWQDKKISFVLAITGLSLGLLGVIIALLIRLI